MEYTQLNYGQEWLKPILRPAGLSWSVFANAKISPWFAKDLLDSSGRTMLPVIGMGEGRSIEDFLIAIKRALGEIGFRAIGRDCPHAAALLWQAGTPRFQPFSSRKPKHGPDPSGPWFCVCGSDCYLTQPRRLQDHGSLLQRCFASQGFGYLLFGLIGPLGF